MIAGHRGARNLWPENSLSGFAKLIALGVEAVEFDVHLSDAGELLIIHDATLDRTTDHTGLVRSVAMDERHDVLLLGSDDEGIPTLAEVLALYGPTGFELHVELKADAEKVPYVGLEAAAIAAIEAAGLAERCVLTSFSLDVLQRCRVIAPHIRTLFSIHKPSAERLGLRQALEAALATADIIAVEMALLADEWDVITGLVPLDRLGAWVPNSEDELKLWLGKGLRQITTDRPDLALEYRPIPTAGNRR